MSEKYPLLLAHTWDGEMDPTGWHMSEKLDGVRAYWDPKRGLISRLGNVFAAPDWFIAGFPGIALDGELWGGRGNFNEASGICRSQTKDDRWKKIIYVVFDAPTIAGNFESRMAHAQRVIPTHTRAKWHEHVVCESRLHMNKMLGMVLAQKGEGLMLRRPGSLYERKRSKTLLKVKTWQTDEAVVIGHNPYEVEKRAGNFKGWTGSLQCQRRNGALFDVGSGLDDVLRKTPPPVGTTIVFHYFEESEEGVPRFPTYGGVSADKIVEAKRK